MKTREEILSKIEEYRSEIARLEELKTNTHVMELYANYQTEIIELTNKALTLYWVLNIE